MHIKVASSVVRENTLKGRTAGSWLPMVNIAECSDDARREEIKVAVQRMSIWRPARTWQLFAHLATELYLGPDVPSHLRPDVKLTILKRKFAARCWTWHLASGTALCGFYPLQTLTLLLERGNDPPIYPLLCHLDTVISTPQFPCDLFIWSIVRLLPVLGIFPLVCSRSMTLRLSITDLFNNQFLNSFSWLPVTYVRRTTWTSAVFGQFCASYRYKYACQGHLKLYAFKYKYTFQGYMHLYAHNCIWRHGSTAGKIPQLWGIG